MADHSKEEHHWRTHNGRHLSDICCELLITLKETFNCLGCCSWCGGGDVPCIVYVQLLMHGEDTGRYEDYCICPKRTFGHFDPASVQRVTQLPRFPIPLTDS